VNTLCIVLVVADLVQGSTSSILRLLSQTSPVKNQPSLPSSCSVAATALVDQRPDAVQRQTAVPTMCMQHFTNF